MRTQTRSHRVVFYCLIGHKQKINESPLHSVSVGSHTTFCSAISRDDKMNHFWHEDTPFDLNMPNMRIQTQYISWNSAIITTLGFYEQAFFFGFRSFGLAFIPFHMSSPCFFFYVEAPQYSPSFLPTEMNLLTLFSWSVAWSAFKLKNKTACWVVVGGACQHRIRYSTGFPHSHTHTQTHFFFASFV